MLKDFDGKVDVIHLSSDPNIFSTAQGSLKHKLVITDGNFQHLNMMFMKHAEGCMRQSECLASMGC